MDDVLRRLGIVESLVAETREDVSAIKAAFAHLATKADVSGVKAGVSAIKATLPHLATKEDVAATKADINGVRADINALETRIIRWIVGTTIAAASVAFTIAKFVH
jgi:hypothetical protein